MSENQDFGAASNWLDHLLRRDRSPPRNNNNALGRTNAHHHRHHDGNTRTEVGREPLKNVCHCDVEPYITLFFDVEKTSTIAVLSRPTGPLVTYFLDRVQRGIARQRSILYYELDGFVRENFTHLCKQPFLRPGCLKIALGALEMSDKEHKRVLEQIRRREMNAHRQSTPDDFGRLEEVMEIARLHWLNDDLDALTIYFLAQANRTMRCIAHRIARHRIQELSVVVTPFADGAPVSGFSNFNRSVSSSMVQHLEAGRTVEYQQCSEIEFVHSCLRTPEQFAPGSEGSAEFSWSCEELALGNLHRSWGDIEDLEYAGQKLIVSCIPSPADVVGDDPEIALSSVQLEPNPHPGTRDYHRGFTSLSLDILYSQMKQLDDVAVLYSGKSRILSLSISFLALVRAIARRRLSRLTLEMDMHSQTRPLLPHEIQYLSLVREAASLWAE